MIWKFLISQKICRVLALLQKGFMRQTFETELSSFETGSFMLIKFDFDFLKS